MKAKRIIKLKLFGIIFLTILTTDKFMAQEKLKLYPDDLIFIKNIPKSNEVTYIEIKKGMNFSTILDESVFLNALDNNAKSLNPKDKILSEWHYSSWYSISLLTLKGEYDIELFLGGLGYMTLPSGQRGAILFDFKKNEKPSYDKK